MRDVAGLRGRSLRRGGGQGPDRMATLPDRVGGRPPSRSDPGARTVRARPGAAHVEASQSRRPDEGCPAAASGCGGGVLTPRSLTRRGLPCQGAGVQPRRRRPRSGDGGSGLPSDLNPPERRSLPGMPQKCRNLHRNEYQPVRIYRTRVNSLTRAFIHSRRSPGRLAAAS